MSQEDQNQGKPDMSVAETREALRQYLLETKMTQTKVAMALRLSTASISTFLGGTYKGNIAGLAERVREFLRRQGEKQVIQSMPFVRTNQALNALAVLRYCQINHCIGVIYGPAGVGKTAALKHFCDNNRNVFMITCDTWYSKYDVLEDIFEAVIGKEFDSYCSQKNIGGGKKKMERLVKQELRGADIMVLVDEAHKLDFWGFECLRELNDKTGIAIVLAGSDEVMSRMTGRKNIVYDQIFSRVKMRRQLSTKMETSDVDAMLAEGGIETSKDISQFMTEKAREKGHFRYMKNILELGLKFAGEAGRQLEVDDLVTAEVFLMQPEKMDLKRIGI